MDDDQEWLCIRFSFLPTFSCLFFPSQMLTVPTFEEAFDNDWEQCSQVTTCDAVWEICWDWVNSRVIAHDNTSSIKTFHITFDNSNEEKPQSDITVYDVLKNLGYITNATQLHLDWTEDPNTIIDGVDPIEAAKSMRVSTSILSQFTVH
jgi:hypothetical protein